MKKINIGLFNFNLLPIIIGIIFAFLNRLFVGNKILKNVITIVLFDHPIIINIYYSIARSLAGIPLIIYKYRIRRNLTKTEKKGNKFFDNINIANNIKKNKGKFSYILLIAIIYFFQEILLACSIDSQSNTWIIEILIMCIFSYIILKIKLYRHHYLSIAIIIIIGISLDLVLKNIQSDVKYHKIEFMLKLIRELIISLNYVIIKYAMNEKFITPYEITCYSGILMLIFNIIIAVILYRLNTDFLDNIQSYFDNFNSMEIYGLIILIVTHLGLLLSLIFTTEKNTACHIFIIYAFGNLAYYMIDFKDIGNIIIKFICLVCIVFMSLVFYEIIELNFCNLSVNTKKNITERAQKEVLIDERAILYNDDDSNNCEIQNYEVQMDEVSDTNSTN